MAEDLSPEQVKAARALLAWTQPELASQAKIATSTLADFERGSRKPVANNALAIRDALEREGLKFVGGGVIAGAAAVPPPAPRLGKLMRWLEASHLVQWGASRVAQGMLPEVVSRLIYAVVGPGADLRFPAHDSIQQGGWDGICTAPAGKGFVPDGVSAWEFTTQKDKIKSKAGGDYEKRKKDPLGLIPKDTTYVFLTTQRFPRKEVWEKEKRAEGFWRDVRVIDADALVHWLEQNPGVAQWLAEKMKRRPPGLRSVQEFWDEWSLATKPALTMDVILTDRDAESTAILKWLRGAEATHPITADSVDEAVAFLHASVSRLPGAYRLAYQSRSVVATDLDAARALVDLGTPLIVCVIDGNPGLHQRLVDSGHYVYAIRTAAAGDRNATKLPRPWRFNLRLALAAMGFAEEEAHRLSRASARSLTVVRRIAVGGTIPAWAVPSPELNAAVLIGGWNDKSKVDCDLLAEIAGKPYEEVETFLARLAALEEAPIRRIGSIWRLGSLRDAWPLLAPSIPGTQFARFVDAFHRVLSAPNPRYDQANRERWVEKEGEFGDEASPIVRHGLSQTMIALGVYPEQASALDNGRGQADAAIRKLLQGADAKLWWSLRGEFQELAEASPEEFLKALENGLGGPEPAVNSLFESEEGWLHPQEYLSDLLWALEMLARSPKYLPQASLLLAKLDRMDPGGKLANRPARSLRQIFLPWTPQTYATPSQRLRVIDQIVIQYPDVGWDLLVSLAPRHHDTSQPSPYPDWRDFTPDQREEITWSGIAKAATETGNRLLAHVGQRTDRWDKLLELWSNFDPTWRATASGQLLDFARGLRDEKEVEEIRETVRDLLYKHRNFADTDWAMPEADLKVFDELLAILAPNTPQGKFKWLFVGSSHFLRPNVAFEDLQAEQTRLQTEAAAELLTLSDTDLLDFAVDTTHTHSLGASIANSAAKEMRKRALLLSALRDERHSSEMVAMGYMIAKVETAGGQWLQDLWNEAIESGWAEDVQLRIALAMPVVPSTWAQVEAQSESLASSYWDKVPIFPIPSSADQIEVSEKLIQHGRAAEYMSWLHHHLRNKPDVGVVLKTLHAAASSEARRGDHNMFGYYLGHLLDYLEQAEGVSEMEVVQLEWTFFQSLRFSERRTRAMNKALANHPEFFVQLVKMVYRPAKDSDLVEEDPPDFEQAKRAATQAWNVLHDWSRVPGSDDAGRIDGAALEDWVTKVRKELHAAGRGEVADYRIGEVLAAARAVDGEPWPPGPVREIIERVRTSALEEGMVLGVINRRGVTVRMPNDGGQLEREEATKYRQFAEELRFEAVRTASVLDRIADHYEEHAKREDDGAELRDIE